MITILFAYRNREISRIKKSLESLKIQSNQNFSVEFVDYGSEFKNSQAVQALLSNYNFVNYNYYYTLNQPWNKAKALNSVLKKMQTSFCFVADVDMIFAPHFIEKLITLQELNKVIYFKVGYLNENESKLDKQFNKYQINHFGTNETTGMTMFPVKKIQEIRGYDEFYHFWGSEDTDLHERLSNLGVEVQYYDTEILVLHQWHKSYMRNEQNSLTKELQLSNIIPMNHQHLLFAKKFKKTIVNHENWGEIPSKTDFNLLQNIPDTISVTNQKEKIDDLLFAQLPILAKNGINITFQSDVFQNSMKYKLKKLLGKKVPNYYTLKEINDIVLLHIISFYRDDLYTYQVSDDLKSINFTLKKIH